jgi:hypothetical protein
VNQYLIPANAKRGELIFGLFRPFDLILLGSGIGVSFILLMLVELSSAVVAAMVLAPALICAFLVVPVPHYHNMLVVITEAFEFLTHRQKYIWKGWCAISDAEKDK